MKNFLKLCLAIFLGLLVLAFIVRIICEVIIYLHPVQGV